VGAGRAVCGEGESGREWRPRSSHTLTKIIKKQVPHPVLHIWYLTYKTRGTKLCPVIQTTFWSITTYCFSSYVDLGQLILSFGGEWDRLIGIGTGGAGGAIAPPIFLEGGLSPPNILGKGS